MSAIWSWIDAHGRSNAYESTISSKIEAARVAHVSTVEIDATRFVDLDKCEQVNRISKKRRPIVRSVPESAVDEDDESHETAALSTVFADEVFHFAKDVERDTTLQKFITEHGGKLAKHLHKGVTKIVREFSDEKDDRVVTSKDIYAAVSAADFTPIVVISPTSSTKSKARLDSAREASTSTTAADAKVDTPVKKPKTSATASTTPASATPASSTLAPAVSEFVSWIGNLDDLNEALKKFELDLDRIGRFTPSQLSKGFSILSDVLAVLAKKYDRKRLEQLSSDFYSAIPHNTGSKRPPLIDSLSMVESKNMLLRNLQHMSFATSLHGGSKTSIAPDKLYRALHVDLHPIVPLASTAEFERVERYINETCDAAHPRVSVETVLAVHRFTEARFEPSASPERELMLWHGTRKTNMMSLLRNGLQVAPPEAPLTGSMFGAGIYSSACASKSAQYCRVDEKSPRGVLLLLAVRVGRSERRTHADPSPPKAGFQSVMGAGVTTNSTATLDECGIEWPGALQPSGLESGLLDTQTSLAFDEFVVYDAARVRVRYAVIVRFHFAKKSKKTSKKSTE